MDSRGIAVTIGGRKWLLVADTHIGIEIDMAARGVMVPSQTGKILNEIIKIAEEEGANSIAVLGDLKHELPLPLESTLETKQFIAGLSSKFENVLIVLGNHDGGLDKIISGMGMPNVTYVDSRGILLEGTKNLLLLHGNSKPREEDFVKSDVIVMGHTHPAISIQDSTGYLMRRPVIIRLEISKRELSERMYGKRVGRGKVTVIVMPTFNPLTIGIDVPTALMGKTNHNTILNYMEPWNRKKDVEIYLTDMTFLGTLSGLSDDNAVTHNRRSNAVKRKSKAH